MSNIIWPATFACLSTLLGFSVCHSVRVPTPKPLMRPVLNRTHTAAKDREEKEPTFEETKAFILKYTRKAWKESPGDRHTYTLAFVNKRLRYSHKFTSDFVAGYLEKMEVALSDLDPTQVGKDEQALGSISLSTTDEESKIAVEVISLAPIDGATNQKYLARTMLVPGYEQDTDEQEKMDARLKKAWAHLIKLAGGKRSKEHSF